jgi:hypothetical protein
MDRSEFENVSSIKAKIERDHESLEKEWDEIHAEKSFVENEKLKIVSQKRELSE